MRAYALDDVDVWLESAPVTHAWLSAERGFHPYGYRSADQWWKAWASQTSPHLTESLVLAGREKAVKSLVERLEGDPQITLIKGKSRDEVLAFIIAAISLSLPDLRGEQLLARMGFVDERASWRELLDQPSPLLLVPMRAEFALDRPTSSPHHVIVPVTHGPASDAHIDLPRVDSESVSRELLKAGMDEEKAKQSGYLARRSLEALRLHLAPNRTLLTPTGRRGQSLRSVELCY